MGRDCIGRLVYCAVRATGSHKSELLLPRERPTSIDLPQVTHVPMQAGDVLLFLAGQVTHGAFKWANPISRRCVLHNYIPQGRALRWHPGQFREEAPLDGTQKLVRSTAAQQARL